MQIANIRLGHATNSSSSHSIIILPEGKQSPGGHTVSYGEYGWENFVLKDADDKMAYLAAGVGDVIERTYGEQIANAIMREWFPDLKWDNGWYIDHSSRIDAPLDSKTGQISFELIEDFKTFMRRDDVVILGGNDNNELPDSYEALQGNRFDYPMIDAYGDNMRALKSGHWWTLYNADTGAKVRFSFKKEPTKLLCSSAPELVDLKITNYCPFKCAYCYQSSTEDGVHADINIIKKYMVAMQKSGVFEIAIGGGEPTLHPEFPQILKMARVHNITPNFTTRVLPDKWSTDTLNAVREYAGSFAVSVDEPFEVAKLHAASVLYDFRGRTVAHFVVGAHRNYHLESVIKSCAEKHIPLTLLGYKDTGRGKSYPQTKQYVTAGVLKSAWRLSVDTSFVELYPDILKDAGIPDVLIVPGEGRFSMYIDAVSQRAGISSYHLDTLQEFEPSYWHGLDEIWLALNQHVENTV
jgi:hypothetical protein